ncbi:MAG: hypothetical protein IT442_17660 [Phycisphaeraceae bacterium]|nr:hypothetical protein [Phycisphaeraceae bacterium]
MHRHNDIMRRLIVGVVAGLGALSASGELAVYPGAYARPGTAGYQTGKSVAFVLAGDRVIGNGEKLDAGLSSLGPRAFAWDATGAVTEFDGLGVRSDGYTQIGVWAWDATGGAVGSAIKWGESDSNLGKRPVRWDGGGGAHELELPEGAVGGTAEGVNTSGAAVGLVGVHGAEGQNLGNRAARWDEGGAAQLLEAISAKGNGYAYAEAVSVNGAGVAVGYSNMYGPTDNLLGNRAVRWDASSAVAVELESLGMSASGYAFSRAEFINDAGVIVGDGFKYDASGVYLGWRGIRWEGESTEATELGTLGTDVNGLTNSFPNSMNAAGTAVGFATKYDGSGASLGARAVRWGASGTAATELPTLGLDVDGVGWAVAEAVNEGGLIVGASARHDLGSSVEVPALWTPEGRVVDLSSLIADGGRWELGAAADISDEGWIAGLGVHDPDGLGGQSGYEQVWMLHVTYFKPGDFNIDGSVNVQDINPFVAAMSGEEGYRGYLTGRMSTLGIDAGELELILRFVDPSGDGLINVQDINPFVAMMTGQGIEVDVSVIPEPGVGGVMVAAAVVGLVRRRG